MEANAVCWANYLSPEQLQQHGRAMWADEVWWQRHDRETAREVEKNLAIIESEPPRQPIHFTPEERADIEQRRTNRAYARRLVVSWLERINEDWTCWL